MKSLYCLLLLSVVAGILGKCPSPQPPEFGKATLKYFADGMRVMYSCEEGRRLKGNKIAVCIGDNWDHPTPTCVIHNPLRRSRLDIYVGDEPAHESTSQESKLQESEDQNAEKGRSRWKGGLQKKVRRRGGVPQKDRKTREHRKNGTKRWRASQEEARSNVPGAIRLNETVVSQLDTSCTKKNPKKRPVKAPSIEHAHKPRYARLLQTHIC